MNVSFFLTPKSDVAVIESEFTIKKAIETIHEKGFTAVPIINEEGKYLGTITEGDFLWYILKKGDVDEEDFTNTKVKDIKFHVKNQPVNIEANMEDLFQLILDQNFVPVVDDRQVFIGIVTRKDVIQYLGKK